MAHVYVTEYADIAASGDPIVPPVAEQVLTLSLDTTSHESAAVNVSTSFVEVVGDQPFSVAFGTLPSATRSNQLVPVGARKRFRVPSGHSFVVSAVYNPLN